MKLQISQLLNLASAAGFSGDDLAIAVAISLAESEGGDPQAYNPERKAGAPEGQGSFGLWQIYLHAHPEYAGVNLFDPQTNAAAAFAIYSAAGSSFRPWSTFGNGDYLSYLDAVNQVIAASASPDVGGGNQAPPDSSGGSLLALVAAGGLIFWIITRVMG